MVIFDLTYSATILPELLWAFRINILATVLAFLIAASLGLVLALMRRSPSLWLRGLAGGYIQLVRSTPLLVQLFFLYFILPQYGIRLEALTIGIIALGAHYATYTAEVYRSGIGEVPRQQWEAGVALGYSRWEIWWRIILPQAVPPIVPVLGNYFISIIKDTPLLAAITVADTMQRAIILGARTYQYLEPVTIVGLMMLIASLILAGGVRALEAYLKTRPALAYIAHR